MKGQQRTQGTNGTSRPVRSWMVWGSVALAGFLSLAVELSLSRLLRPWFGDMLIVWAAIIGFVLLYLALGNIIGGRWSEHTSVHRLNLLLTLAGVGIYLMPLVTHPLLALAQRGMRAYALTLPAVALGVTFVLLAFPLTLLGTISPQAVALLTGDRRESGRVAGRVLALGTFASLLGAFLPVFWLLPQLGTRRTFALLGVMPLAWAGLTWLLQRRRRWGVAALGLLLVGVLALPVWASGPLKGMDPSGRGRVLYEEETLYSYIQVVEWQGERWLRLNEGEGIHSVWRPGPGLSGGIWDYFLLAPAFRAQARTGNEVNSLLVIGLAGGTIPILYARAFGPVHMVGVELDPAIIRVAYRYFGLGELSTLEAVAGDGRVVVAHSQERFDVIAVDAYRPPYIPFHLTTVEFFQLLKDHLTPGGVVAVNAARTADDFSLVDALSGTMQQVFPAVYIVDEPLNGAAWGNSVVIASREPVSLEDIRARLAHTSNPYVREMARRAEGHIRPAPAATIVLTDDRAPIEQIVHGIIWRYVRGDGKPRHPAEP